MPLVNGIASLGSDSTLTAQGNETFFYVGSGGVHVGGAAPVTVEYTWDSPQSWNINGVITFEISFTWDDGEQPLKWYRIEGCCRFPTAAGSGLPPPNNLPGGCQVIPFQSEDSKCQGALGQNTFIQVIAAHNLSEVCQILTAMNWNWPICGISVFSTPADNRFVTPEMTCNVLTDLPQSNWCSLPACQELCLQTHGISDMGMSVTGGIILSQYVGIGGVHIGGSGGYAPLTGGITTGPNWQQRGNGGVHVGGSAPTINIPDLGYVTNMGVDVGVLDVTVDFSTTADSDVPAIPTETGTIATNCIGCTSMPPILFLVTNLNLGSVLAEFCTRNALVFPTTLLMYYINRTGAWESTVHFTGIGDDNDGTQEYWRVLVDWECTNIVGGQDFGSYFWKLGVSVLRRKLATGAIYNTRLMLVFPPATICSNGPNFDFEVAFDTQTQQVSTNPPGIVPQQVLLYDNIGMFTTQTWVNAPDLGFELSQNPVVSGFISQDISSIFPKPAQQVGIG